MASAGSFCFKVVVGMTCVPSHVHSAANAQAILGTSCSRVEMAPPEALDDPKDDREFFVAAWCIHPRLISEEKIIAVPKPEVHDPAGLFLRPHEIIHAHLPTLRYLVRLRIIEFQDWNTPPSSPDDEGGWGRRDEDDDSDDSNYNGYHPGLDDVPSRSRRAPTTTCFGNSGNGGGPVLGRGSGPTFRPRQQVLLVGSVVCLVGESIERWVPMMLTRAVSAVGAAVHIARTHAAVPDEVDLTPPVSATTLADLGMPLDPMCEEATFQVAVPMIGQAVRPVVITVDADPVCAVDRPGEIRGTLARMLAEDVSLLGTAVGPRSYDPPDGPRILFSPSVLSLACTKSTVVFEEVGPSAQSGCAFVVPPACPHPELPAVESMVEQELIPDVMLEPFELLAEAQPADICATGEVVPALVKEPIILVHPSDEGTAVLEPNSPGDALAAFIDSIKTPLPQPVLASTHVLRVTRTRREIEEGACVIPKQGAHLAAKSKFREC